MLLEIGVGDREIRLPGLERHEEEDGSLSFTRDGMLALRVGDGFVEILEPEAWPALQDLDPAVEAHLPDRGAPFLRRGSTLTVPGMDLEDLDDVEAACEAIRQGRITQGIVRNRGTAWVEWTRLDLGDRYLKRARGTGCAALRPPAVEVRTWEPW